MRRRERMGGGDGNENEKEWKMWNRYMSRLSKMEG